MLEGAPAGSEGRSADQHQKPLHRRLEQQCQPGGHRLGPGEAQQQQQPDPANACRDPKADRVSMPTDTTHNHPSPRLWEPSRRSLNTNPSSPVTRRSKAALSQRTVTNNNNNNNSDNSNNNNSNNNRPLATFGPGTLGSRSTPRNKIHRSQVDDDRGSSTKLDQSRSHDTNVKRNGDSPDMPIYAAGTGVNLASSLRSDDELEKYEAREISALRASLMMNGRKELESIHGWDGATTTAATIENDGGGHGDGDDGDGDDDDDDDDADDDDLVPGPTPVLPLLSRMNFEKCESALFAPFDSPFGSPIGSPISSLPPSPSDEESGDPQNDAGDGATGVVVAAETATDGEPLHISMSYESDEDEEEAEEAPSTRPSLRDSSLSAWLEVVPRWRAESDLNGTEVMARGLQGTHNGLSPPPSPSSHRLQRTASWTSASSRTSSTVSTPPFPRSVSTSSNLSISSRFSRASIESEEFVPAWAGNSNHLARARRLAFNTAAGTVGPSRLSVIEGNRHGGGSDGGNNEGECGGSPASGEGDREGEDDGNPKALKMSDHIAEMLDMTITEVEELGIKNFNDNSLARSGCYGGHAGRRSIVARGRVAARGPQKKMKDMATNPDGTRRKAISAIWTNDDAEARIRRFPGVEAARLGTTPGVSFETPRRVLTDSKFSGVEMARRGATLGSRSDSEKFRARTVSHGDLGHKSLGRERRLARMNIAVEEMNLNELSLSYHALEKTYLQKLVTLRRYHCRIIKDKKEHKFLDNITTLRYIFGRCENLIRLHTIVLASIEFRMQEGEPNTWLLGVNVLLRNMEHMYDMYAQVGRYTNLGVSLYIKSLNASKGLRTYMKKVERQGLGCCVETGTPSLLRAPKFHLQALRRHVDAFAKYASTHGDMDVDDKNAYEVSSTRLRDIIERMEDEERLAAKKKEFTDILSNMENLPERVAKMLAADDLNCVLARGKFSLVINLHDLETKKTMQARVHKMGVRAFIPGVMPRSGNDPWSGIIDRHPGSGWPEASGIADRTDLTMRVSNISCFLFSNMFLYGIAEEKNGRMTYTYRGDIPMWKLNFAYRRRHDPTKGCMKLSHGKRYSLVFLGLHESASKWARATSEAKKIYRRYRQFFGVQLVTILTREKREDIPSLGDSSFSTPNFIFRCYLFLRSNFLGTLGLFRTNGSRISVKKYRTHLNSGETPEIGTTRTANPHVVANLITNFFLEMRYPLTHERQEAFLRVMNDFKTTEERVNQVTAIVSTISSTQKACLQELMLLLSQVANTEGNNVTAGDLALTFSVPLLRHSSNMDRCIGRCAHTCNAECEKRCSHKCTSRCSKECKGKFCRHFDDNKYLDVVTPSMLVSEAPRSSMEFSDAAIGVLTLMIENYVAVFKGIEKSERQVQAKIRINMLAVGHVKEVKERRVQVMLRKAAQMDVETPLQGAPRGLAGKASMSVETVVKQGWMMKKGAKHGIWSKRWFVLKYRCLSYFVNSQLQLNKRGAGDTPRGRIVLSSSMLVDYTGNDIRPNQFSLTVDDREFMLDPESKRERTLWVEAIEKAA